MLISLALCMLIHSPIERLYGVSYLSTSRWQCFISMSGCFLNDINASNRDILRATVPRLSVCPFSYLFICSSEDQEDLVQAVSALPSGTACSLISEFPFKVLCSFVHLVLLPIRNLTFVLTYLKLYMLLCGRMSINPLE